MFLPYAVEDNYRKGKKTELNVVLNESLNTINDKKLKKKKSPNFVAGYHVVHFYFLQNQDLSLCKLLIILCGFCMKNNNQIKYI
jgi:hypothetical protein